jgi:hypothetical protein
VGLKPASQSRGRKEYALTQPATNLPQPPGRRVISLHRAQEAEASLAAVLHFASMDDRGWEQVPRNIFPDEEECDGGGLGTVGGQGSYGAHMLIAAASPVADAILPEDEACGPPVDDEARNQRIKFGYSAYEALRCVGVKPFPDSRGPHEHDPTPNSSGNAQAQLYATVSEGR